MNMIDSIWYNITYKCGFSPTTSHWDTHDFERLRGMLNRRGAFIPVSYKFFGRTSQYTQYRIPGPQIWDKNTPPCWSHFWLQGCLFPRSGWLSSKRRHFMEGAWLKKSFRYVSSTLGSGSSTHCMISQQISADLSSLIRSWSDQAICRDLQHKWFHE